jgi:hypothetical protein
MRSQIFKLYNFLYIYIYICCLLITFSSLQLFVWYLELSIEEWPYSPQLGLNFVFITVWFIWMVCDRHLQNGEFSKETSCSDLVHQCISQGFGVRLTLLKRNYYKSSLLWSNIKSWSARSAQPGFGMGGWIQFRILLWSPSIPLGQHFE